MRPNTLFTIPMLLILAAGSVLATSTPISIDTGNTLCTGSEDIRTNIYPVSSSHGCGHVQSRSDCRQKYESSGFGIAIDPFDRDIWYTLRVIVFLRDPATGASFPGLNEEWTIEPGMVPSFEFEYSHDGPETILWASTLFRAFHANGTPFRLHDTLYCDLYSPNGGPIPYPEEVAEVVMNPVLPFPLPAESLP